MSTIIWIVILIVALAAGIGAGYFIGYNNRKKTAEARSAARKPRHPSGERSDQDCDQKRKEAILEAKDFNLVAAGAFVANHAFSNILAAGRPDEADLADVEGLSRQVVQASREDCPTGPLAVDGDAEAPYYIPQGEDGKPAKFLKAVPKTDMEKCTSCGLCAQKCPMVPSISISRRS